MRKRENQTTSSYAALAFLVGCVSFAVVSLRPRLLGFSSAASPFPPFSKDLLALSAVNRIYTLVSQRNTDKTRERSEGYLPCMILHILLGLRLIRSHMAVFSKIVNGWVCGGQSMTVGRVCLVSTKFLTQFALGYILLKKPPWC